VLILGITTSTMQVGCAIGGHEGVLGSIHSSRGKRHAETLTPAVTFRDGPAEAGKPCAACEQQRTHATRLERATNFVIPERVSRIKQWSIIDCVRELHKRLRSRGADSTGNRRVNVTACARQARK
jgi:hypothetical protein